MKIKIVAVGKLKNSPMLDLCEEYAKRIGKDISIKEIDAPKGSTSIVEEPLILKNLSNAGILVALDERGETLSSPDFAKKFDKWQTHAHSDGLTFLIGGADGLTDTVRQKADFLMSFGKQTWPHMLVRVMLLEQIYRARQILAGHPYHRV